MSEIANFNTFSDTPPDLDYSASTEIAGRIKRGPGIGRAEAIKKAKSYKWWDAALKYDGRSKVWHVFRRLE